MRDYVILTDSCCDFSARMAEELELTVLPLSFTMEGREYFNYPDNRDIAPRGVLQQDPLRRAGHHLRHQRGSLPDGHGAPGGGGPRHFVHLLLLQPVHHLSVRLHRRPGGPG